MAEQAQGTQAQAFRQGHGVHDAMPFYDVVIVGGGFAGLTLGLALRHLSRSRLSLALVDKKKQKQDTRALAIAAGARRILEKIDAWPAEFAQPIHSMRITDSGLHDGVRPSLLNFAGEVEANEPFAHMIESHHLQNSLASAFLKSGIATIDASVCKTFIEGQERFLSLDNGSILRTRLVAACDGARSKLREEIKTQLIGRNYDQAAIVTTIAHEDPHHGEAIEHFLPAGPFAALPLIKDEQGRHRSSIVWTENKKSAAQLTALSEEAFLAELTERLGHCWGTLSLAGPIQSFPLSIKLARRFVAERLALVGDAAHIIHPIAGQGLNFGFRDIAALSEVLVDALQLGCDIGAGDILARYQRWRRFDTLMMGIATDSLNTLFSNESIVLRGLRSLGLSIVDRTPPLKDFFIASAAGALGDVPKLMRPAN
jgi:2-octaprenyl-6-methoxyphenol hydroxylase